MDWYYGSGVDDFIVPKDQGVSDRIPSPDSWSKWGISDSESYQELDKCFVFDPKFMKQESSYNDRSICDEVGMGDSIHDKYQSCSSSICGGSSNESIQQNTISVSCNQHDYQLEGLVGLEQMDDTFLNSLLEDLPDDGIQSSLCPEPNRLMTQSSNPFSDMYLDCHSNAGSLHSVGSPKHQKEHAFSPHSTQSDYLPMKWKFLVPCEQNTMKGQNRDAISLEETILHDLKTVTTQLTEKTRICFRDSLYRLAKNSEQHHITQNQDGDIQKEINHLETYHAEIMRSRPKRSTESETNAIDRTIANLMFNKIDLNVQDLLVAASLNPNQEAIHMPKPPDNKFNQSLAHQLNHNLILPQDIKVPKIFTRGDLYATTNSNTSSRTAGSKSFVLDFSSSGG